MDYEKKRFFSSERYDIAISYWQGYNTLFVDKYINAEKKIMFYQVAVDEAHEVHQNTMPHFDKIVVEHEDIKNALCSWYDNIDDKIIVLENHTDSQMLYAMSKEKNIEKQTNVTIICTCARFSKVKGIDLAVEAARILKEKNIGYKWYLVGDGPIRVEIEELINKYELDDNIILTGMQNNPYPYMAASDIYVQPSYEEALSIAMLESQILGVPMVSTKTAGGLAMVEDGVNGYLADINAEALAAAIEKMIVDSAERRKMKEYLSGIDYSKEQIRYENDWRNLLGD
jgi:glycosyltransferase involved in cell wall biosynthesis